MVTISLCMIVKNEELILESGLRSIKDVADEIIITDTGSTDSTVEIAKKFTDKIYSFPWIDSFAAARNANIGNAKCEYILWWDADFVLRNGDLDKILELKKNDFYNANLNYFTWNVEFSESGIPIKSLLNGFIYTRKDFHWESPIHNKLVPNDPQFKPAHKYYPEIEVNHYKDRVTKAHRYEQTAKILIKVLKENPNDIRLLLNYAEGLIFDKKFSQAAEILNKALKLEKNDIKKILIIELLVMCDLILHRFGDAKKLVNDFYIEYANNSRFILSYADATAIKDLEGAKEYYLKYLKNPVKKGEDVFGYDYERYIVHPYFMMGHIFMKEGNIPKAINYYEYVQKNSRLKQTCENAKLIQEKIQLSF